MGRVERASHQSQSCFALTDGLTYDQVSSKNINKLDIAQELSLLKNCPLEEKV